MRFIGPLPHTRRLALAALAAVSTLGAAHAQPPPQHESTESFLTTYKVENAQVTREVIHDHPVYRHHRICVDGPLPAEGFDARYMDIRLRRGEPSQLDVLLKPVVEPDGRVCTLLSGAVAVEPELIIEIHDVRQFYTHYLYYAGPLLEIPAKKVRPAR